MLKPYRFIDGASTPNPRRDGLATQALAPLAALSNEPDARTIPGHYWRDVNLHAEPMHRHDALWCYCSVQRHANSHASMRSHLFGQTGLKDASVLVFQGTVTDAQRRFRRLREAQGVVYRSSNKRDTVSPTR